jgi:tetratricopeptide (TPR) repeat protein
MIFLHTLLLVVALASSMQEMLWEYRLQMKADALYERRAYREAETVFRQLVSLSPEPKKRAAATFNLACALYMQGKYPEAGTLFASNSKPGNEHRENRLKAIFNEGNTLAMQAIGSSAKAQKSALFRQSLNCFKSVLLTNPDDGDSKINYEIVHRYLDELEKPEQSSSSTTKNKSSYQPTSGIGKGVADRLLENAQQDESSLMRRLSGAGKSASQSNKNNQDW